MTYALVPDPYLSGEYPRTAPGLHYLVGAHGAGTTSAAMAWAVTAAATGAEVLVHAYTGTERAVAARLANAAAGRPLWAPFNGALPPADRSPQVWVDPDPEGRAGLTRLDQVAAAIGDSGEGGWFVLDDADGLDPYRLRDAAARGGVHVLAVLHTGDSTGMSPLSELGHDERVCADTVTGVHRKPGVPGTVVLVPFKDRSRHPLPGPVDLDVYDQEWQGAR